MNYAKKDPDVISHEPVPKNVVTFGMCTLTVFAFI